MKTVFKILKKVVLIGLGVYAALFAVFFFDLDGKALFYCAAITTAWSAVIR